LLKSKEEIESSWNELEEIGRNWKELKMKLQVEMFNFSSAEALDRLFSQYKAQEYGAAFPVGIHPLACF